jgi:hypothetical protein
VSRDVLLGKQSAFRNKDERERGTNAQDIFERSDNSAKAPRKPVTLDAIVSTFDLL